MTNQWRCGNCGYILEADVPLEVCPGCREHCEFIDANPYVPVEGEELLDQAGPAIIPEVVSEKCTGCRLCIQVCPIEAIDFVDGKAVIDADTCDADGICIPACPEGAIILPE